MIPLALTSTAGWIRRLGGKRWNLLHRLDLRHRRCAGVVHYWWLVKVVTDAADHLRGDPHGAARRARVVRAGAQAAHAAIAAARRDGASATA